ncbi:MAG: type II toxin-antitoxin system VapC family toxin [Caldiserica bacterium]|nr:type II toxin-antitoxin system VapC family toxin [Caldisericota bacterium]
MVYILDTHALVWYLEESPRLGKKALKLLEEENTRLVIPVITLAELKYLVSKSRVEITFENILDYIENDERCILYPLDLNVVELLPSSLDIHDAIICGTALVYKTILGEETKIITRDKAITKSGLVETIW